MNISSSQLPNSHDGKNRVKEKCKPGVYALPPKKGRGEKLSKYEGSANSRKDLKYR